MDTNSYSIFKGRLILSNRILLMLTILILISRHGFSQNGFPVRERVSFNNDWKFFKGDIPFPVVTGSDMTYTASKAGRALGAAKPDFDDKNWKGVSVPHDWVIENEHDKSQNLAQGYRERGIGWYRKSFKLLSSDKGKHLELQFDGVATYCTVWINGTLVHRNWCGYTSFYIDMTALVNYGDEENNITVRVDANAFEGWWYEGGGIYRNTWIVKTAPVHFITDGIFTNPVKINGSWNIPLEATIENSGENQADVTLETYLIDPMGKQVSSKYVSASVGVLVQSITKVTIPVINPQLWSLENPVLYHVKTLIKQNGRTLDSVVTQCGFRTIRFTADSGFFLNDKHVKLKGTANHQDHAGVGVAVPASLWEFRLRKLKEMGSNAYRCAHNPPSNEFLDDCDKMGILVMDENRNFNVSPEYINQLKWMVRRDRNHPSVILWSVFNEEPMQGTDAGYEMVRRMNAVVKTLDTTRPVTAAMNGGFFTPKNVSLAVDVVGFNYNIYNYDKFHKVHPELCLTSSEDVSSIMQRGQYVTDRPNNLLDEYDTQYPDYAASHRDAWKAINERQFMAGGFVWTGFDYHGEPPPFFWPATSSEYGIMDLCGFPKNAYYIHQAMWTEDKPVLHIVPHWNWPKDSIGKLIRVMVASNADHVKLLLNGKTMYFKPVDKYQMFTENVPYYPGKLEAIGYKGGKEISRFREETTGDAISLELLSDRDVIQNDGRDAVPITVRALDAKGRPVPTANSLVEFELSGAGNIIGLGNGDPNSLESEKGNKRSLYHGLAQVILQSQQDGGKTIILTARSKGLKPATITIKLTN